CRPSASRTPPQPGEAAMSRPWFCRRLFGSARPASKPIRRTRLAVEALEDRAVPAVLTVNSLQDLAVNLSDTTVTLRDAIDAANRDVAVAPGGTAGSGADIIVFDPTLFSADRTVTPTEPPGDGSFRPAAV